MVSLQQGVQPVTAVRSPIISIGVLARKLSGDKMYRSVKTAIHVLCELKHPMLFKRRKQTVGMLSTTYPNDYVEIMMSMRVNNVTTSTQISIPSTPFRRHPCRWRLLPLSCLGVWCSPELSAHRRRYSRFFWNTMSTLLLEVMSWTPAVSAQNQSSL